MKHQVSDMTAQEHASFLRIKDFTEEPLRRSAGDAGYKLVPMNAAEMEAHAKWALELDARHEKSKAKVRLSQ